MPQLLTEKWPKKRAPDGTIVYISGRVPVEVEHLLSLYENGSVYATYLRICQIACSLESARFYESVKVFQDVLNSSYEEARQSLEALAGKGLYTLCNPKETFISAFPGATAEEPWCLTLCRGSSVLYPERRNPGKPGEYEKAIIPDFSLYKASKSIAAGPSATLVFIAAELYRHDPVGAMRLLSDLDKKVVAEGVVNLKKYGLMTCPWSYRSAKFRQVK